MPSALSRRELLLGATAAATLGGCAGPFGSDASYLTPVLNPANRNVIFDWIDVILQQVREQRVPPPRAAYNFALPMVAGFLAANGIEQIYDEPFDIGVGPTGADPELAYGVAFATAAAEAFQQPFLFERFDFSARYNPGDAATLAHEWGRQVGLDVVRMRTNDGSEPNRANFYLGRYPRRDDALKWTPTGPFYSAKPGPAFDTFSRPLFPGHGAIKPWTMTHSAQFRAPEFYHPASPEFAEEFNTIRRLGGAQSDIRTEDEAEIALFWEDGPWGITPPGHFVLIGIQVLQDRQLSFIELARAFALIGMTQCDASISSWDSKYHHDIIRPETAIKFRAPAFQNPDPRVVAERKWKSYIPTPEFPAYTSGHSTFGAAGAELIRLIYGQDEVSFSHQSPDQVLWPQIRAVTRSWTSLSQAAEENGLSRLYGGVHWKADHDAGMAAGKAIARQAFASMFPAKA